MCLLKVYMITHTKKRNHLRQIDIFQKIGKSMKVKKSDQNLGKNVYC